MAEANATSVEKPIEKPKVPTLLEQLKGGQTIWDLRYKYIRGITHTLIIASDRDKAEQVGRAWVNSQPGRMFLDVVPAITADESILVPAVTETVGAGGAVKR